MYKKLDNIIRDFLWQNKKSKIAYSTLQLPKEEGGMNLVNLINKDRALKATWPQILYKENEYAVLVYEIMRVSALGHDIWRCNLAPSDIKHMNIKSTFWVDTLRSWCEFNYYNTKREENQIIWYNSMIRVKNKPSFGRIFTTED